MLIPIIVEYKYDDNIVEINLKNKEDYILYKYVYTYNKDNLIDNCKVYKYKSDGSYDCNNVIFDRDSNNTTKVFMNNVLVDEIIKNNNEYIINIYVIKEKLDTMRVMFFNDHIDVYTYNNGNTKFGFEPSWINYFDKNNRLIKTINTNKNLEKSKTTYDYDDKNRIIKKIIKSYKKDINYIYTTTKTFKYDEDSNKCVCNINNKYNNINIENKTIDNLEMYIPNMIEVIEFNTLESQHLLVEYGISFLTYTNYLLLSPYNRDIGTNFKYDNQSRVMSKEIELSDINLDIK